MQKVFLYDLPFSHNIFVTDDGRKTTMSLARLLGLLKNSRLKNETFEQRLPF